MAFDSAADFIAANPNWQTTMVIAGTPGTQDAPIIALIGPTTPAGTTGWVWSRGQPPWFIPIPPIPPAPTLASIAPTTINHVVDVWKDVSVIGSNFTAASTVTVGGAAPANITYVSATALSILVHSGTMTPGPYAVVVTSPGPPSQSSNALTLTIT